MSDAPPPADGLPMNVLVRLMELQEEHGWLSDETLEKLSREERIPLYALGAVTSFYPHYRRSPPPRHSIAVCRDAACHMRGADALLAEVSRRFAGTTDVEVRAVSCLGRCEGAPAAAIDEVPVAPAVANDLAGMASGKVPVPADEPTKTPRRWRTDPYEHVASRYGVLRRLLAAGPGAFD